MSDEPRAEQSRKTRTPWNKGKLTGPRPPLKVREGPSVRRSKQELADPGQTRRARCLAPPRIDSYACAVTVSEVTRMLRGGNPGNHRLSGRGSARRRIADPGQERNYG